jgi:transcription initiation factor TFIID subunit 1
MYYEKLIIWKLEVNIFYSSTLIKKVVYRLIQYVFSNAKVFALHAFLYIFIVIISFMNQLGHMRTNKNCPKYGEDLEAQLESTDMEKPTVKSNSADPSSQSQHKLPSKKSISKIVTKIAPVESATKIPLKFKCSSTEKSSDKPAIETMPSSDKPVTSDSETAKSAKISKIIIPNKVKSEDTQAESLKHAIVIRPPTDPGRSQVDSHKFPIKIRPPAEIDREQSHKKIVIKRTKDVADLELDSPGGNTGIEHRKTKRIVELTSFEKHGKQETMYSTEGLAKWNAKEDRRWWEEHEKRRNEVRLREDKARRYHKEEMRMLKEQEKLDELRKYEEDIRREREEEERQKAKKKKKKRKPDLRDDYLDDPRERRYGKRMQERERSGKRRSVVELGKISGDFMPPTKRRRGGGGEVHFSACHFHYFVSLFYLHVHIYVKLQHSIGIFLLVLW